MSNLEELGCGDLEKAIILGNGVYKMEDVLHS